MYNPIKLLSMEDAASSRQLYAHHVQDLAEEFAIQAKAGATKPLMCVGYNIPASFRDMDAQEVIEKYHFRPGGGGHGSAALILNQARYPEREEFRSWPANFWCLPHGKDHPESREVTKLHGQIDNKRMSLDETLIA